MCDNLFWIDDGGGGGGDDDGGGCAAAAAAADDNDGGDDDDCGGGLPQNNFTNSRSILHSHEFNLLSRLTYNNIFHSSSQYLIYIYIAVGNYYQ